jgi:hypothetical protein
MPELVEVRKRAQNFIARAAGTFRRRRWYFPHRRVGSLQSAYDTAALDGADATRAAR